MLGVCIGERNRRCFIALLVLGAFSYASMAILCVCTLAWLEQAAGRGPRGVALDAALLTLEPAAFAGRSVWTYLLPCVLFTVGALVLGGYAMLHLVCLHLGLRTKTPGVLALAWHQLRLGRRATPSSLLRSAIDEGGLSGSGGEVEAGAAAGIQHGGEGHADTLVDEDDAVEPGCCAFCPASCTAEAHHKAGLGGVLPGASWLTMSFDMGTREGAAAIAALAALAEWLTAAFLLHAHTSAPTAVVLALLGITAVLSVRSPPLLLALLLARPAARLNALPLALLLRRCAPSSNCARSKPRERALLPIGAFSRPVRRSIHSRRPAKPLPSPTRTPIRISTPTLTSQLTSPWMTRTPTPRPARRMQAASASWGPELWNGAPTAPHMCGGHPHIASSAAAACCSWIISAHGTLLSPRSISTHHRCSPPACPPLLPIAHGHPMPAP